MPTPSFFTPATRPALTLETFFFSMADDVKLDAAEENDAGPLPERASSFPPRRALLRVGTGTGLLCATREPEGSGLTKGGGEEKLRPRRSGEGSKGMECSVSRMRVG